MGLYNSSGYWRQAILFLPATIGASLLPILSNLNGKHDRQGFLRVVVTGIFLNACLAILVGLPMVVFSRSIMRSYGRGFDDGGNVLSMMALSGVVIAVNNHISRAVAGMGRMWLSFRFDLSWSLASVILSVILIPRYGALGLATAALLAAIVQSAYQGIVIASARSRPSISLSASG